MERSRSASFPNLLPKTKDQRTPLRLSSSGPSHTYLTMTLTANFAQLGHYGLTASERNPSAAHVAACFSLIIRVMIRTLVSPQCPGG